MKVSVLIPTFKPADYIESCLASLERQKLPKDKFCVYIALNGPQFPYEDYILNILSDKNINYKYIYLNQSGVSNARNRLLDIANEDFIVFLDDDDQISECYLDELLKITTTEVMGISNVYEFTNNSNELKNNFMGEIFSGLKDGERSKFKIRKYFSSPCAKMLHKEMINDVRFDPKLANGEDSLFMAIISNKISYIKKTSENTCYFIYQRTGSASRKKVNVLDEIKRVFYLLGEYMHLFNKEGYDNIFILTRVAATFKQLTRIFKVI